MTTCQHCHQPLPEPRKARECWVVFPLHSQAPRIFGGSTQIAAMMNAVQGGDEVVHMKEVLPIPKEERKPNIHFWDGDNQCRTIELTLAARPA